MLGPTRQIRDLNLNFVKNRAGEAGGIVAYVERSGVLVCGYVDTVVDAIPLGVQLNNVEGMNLSRQYHPAIQRGVRRVDMPNTTVGLSRDCTIDTNFVHPDAQPYSGRKAYLAPSGLVTHDSSFGGPQIGIFLSDINDANIAGLPRGSGYITIFGGGWYRPQVFSWSNGLPTITTEGELATQLVSPGFVRLKVDV